MHKTIYQKIESFEVFESFFILLPQNPINLKSKAKKIKKSQ